MLRDVLKEEISRIAGIEDIKISEPERPENGDYSTNIAFLLAKSSGRKPQEIAEELAKKFSSKISERIEPRKGFLNIFLKDEVLLGALDEKTKFPKKKEKINVEFVSANPTGPLTMANGRGGFYGDALSNVLEKVGYDVTREYYINDAGNQIKLLGESIQAAEGKIPEKEEYYKGEYIKKLKGRSAEEAVEILLGEIKSSLKKAGIEFDEWFSEGKNLRQAREIDKAIAEFEKKNLLDKKDGATWFGDKVFLKSNGDPTYLIVDIAYQRNKIINRKFNVAITIVGPDHHAEAQQVKRGIAALGIPENKLRILMFQVVRLMRSGKEARMSKRTGEFVTLEELLDEVGLDAGRWFFLSHAPNTHMDFDMDLAKERSEKNPVYYVQYAHTRMASILGKSQIPNPKSQIKELEHPPERALIMKILRYPEILEDISRDYQVHRLTTYAYELAQTFSAFYRDVKVIGSEREAELLYLVSKTKETLADLLKLMGISQPEKM